MLDNCLSGELTKSNKIGGACDTYGEGFCEEIFRKESVEKARRRWEYNIKMGLKEMKWAVEPDLSGSG
jgi:hypothetical protein